MFKVKVVELKNPEHSGKYGLGKSRTLNQWFPSFGTGTKEEMEKRAKEHNVGYYYWKAQELYEELGKQYPEEFDAYKYSDAKEFGDLVC